MNISAPEQEREARRQVPNMPHDGNEGAAICITMDQAFTQRFRQSVGMTTNAQSDLRPNEINVFKQVDDGIEGGWERRDWEDGEKREVRQARVRPTTPLKSNTPPRPPTPPKSTISRPTTPSRSTISRPTTPSRSTISRPPTPSKSTTSPGPLTPSKATTSTPSRPPTPLRSSSIAPPGTHVPIPRSLPPRSVSKAAFNMPSRLVMSTQPLQRAVTMRSPTASSLAQGAVRPRSSYTPDIDFSDNSGDNQNSHMNSSMASRDCFEDEAILKEEAPGRVTVVVGSIPPTVVRVGRSPSKVAPRGSSMRRPSTSSMGMELQEKGESQAATAHRFATNTQETRLQDQSNSNGNDFDIPPIRPNAPTPSALPASFQYSPSLGSLSPAFTSSTITPPIHQSQLPFQHAHTSSTSSARARSQSVSAIPSTPPRSSMPLPTVPISPPHEYVAEPYSLPPTTPPHAFARLPKHTNTSYPDPTGFPTPPSYPPVPGLVACGSSSTSTRSSAYTSPGASAPLSTSDLSILGVGLRKYAGREGEHDLTYVEDEALDVRAALTTDKPVPILRSTSYHQLVHESSSESSISRLQFAANAAANAAAVHGNGVPHGWSDGYAHSTRSGSSSYEGSPIPASGTEQQVTKRLVNPKWRSVDQDEDFDDVDVEEAEHPPPSSFQYQRARKGTIVSSRSASASGLTSASEDETDADEYALVREDDDDDLEEAARTAAIVVAEEGTGLIVHGEGMNVTALNIQPGTTHLLLASLSTPNSLPGLLAQTLPTISSTLLALDISANFLGALPPALAACSQLTELNIASNPLRALPVWISSLEGLRVLIADATGITTLPHELISLRALNVLSIRRNKLMALPAWLSRLPALERLEVEGNPFQGPWKMLLAPLINARPPISTGVVLPGEMTRQQQQPPPPSGSSTNLHSLYGPGMSMYGESPSLQPSPLQPSHGIPTTPNEYQCSQYLVPPYSAAQGSFLSTDSESSLPGSGAELNEQGGRRFLQEEEEHTIVQRTLTSPFQHPLPAQVPLPSPSQFAVSSSSLESPSHRSLVSLNSPTQLPYMNIPPARSNGFDRFEHNLEDVREQQEGINPPIHNIIQRVPTFSVADRRAPSPYLRPLSRTRTTPSRSRLSSGSGSGSIATFIAEQEDGKTRSRTSSVTSQRPHTDYAPTKYGGPLGVEDSGYYGSAAEYNAYERRSDGSEFFGGGAATHNGGGMGAGITKEHEEERRTELRRMRSADELRRALESVIGPSEPKSSSRDEDSAGDTETDRAPPFFVPKLDPRPQVRRNHTMEVNATIMDEPVRGITLTDRPGAKRFASLGTAQSLSGSLPTRARPALAEGLWDAEGDADAEGDGDDGGEPTASRPMSPVRVKGRDADVARPPKTSKGKWGFLKKMSMGRMRPEGSSRPSTSQGMRSTQTSPQTPSVPRIATSPDRVANDGSPMGKSRPATREAPTSLPISTATLQHVSTSTSVQLTSTSSSLAPLPQPRSARRRSFLPLDGPPALNIPIPSTAPFLPETLIATNDMDEELKLTTVGAPQVEQLMPSPKQPQIPQQSNDSRALRHVMAYLRDMADLGMASSHATEPMSSTNPSTGNLNGALLQDVEEGRPRRPTIVESGRILSEGSLTSTTSSGSGFGITPSRSEDHRANTMSVATTDSNGSGKGDEERSKHKDDKSKRALIIKEIVETERTYVKGLQELIDIYVKPASLPVNTLGNAVASTKETIIPQQERKIVFNGLDSLFSFHSQSFLPALEHAAKKLLRGPNAEPDVNGEISMTAATSIANVFVSHAAFMRMYSTYINNFDNAVQRLKQWSIDRRAPVPVPGVSMTSPSSSTAHLAGMGLQMSVVSVAGVGDNAVAAGLQPLTTSQRKRIKAYLKRCRLNPKHSQLNLEGYLLLPVQRIPRYRMLLEELVRCTPPRIDAFNDPMDHALTEISSLANNMNEGKREAESRRKLVQWQTRIRGKFPSPLVQPHRRLIMDGPLHLTRVVRKSSVAFDVINSSGDKTNVQVECLAPEETPRSLVGILCNDLLVLCKDQSAGKDHAVPVDLWAVLRMQTLPQPASIVHGNSLRVVDNKAILYFDAPSTSEALTWCRAINMHIPASKT
ncbi:hypothetical protein K439DRAFT_1632325 [Ramaria rubella]|nr:hypothetical protein K439DRAFT_1632325 [Ramaria rubella]